MPASRLLLTRRRLLQSTAGGAAGLLLGASPFRHWALAAGSVQLRLLETTDVHVHVFPYDYYRDREDDTVGLAKTATLVEAARAEAPNSLLLDNGDFIQGNPLGDLMAYERGLKEGDVHPMITAMNRLRFDVATLGNHEFNYGLSFLEKALAGGDFPFVLANVARGRAGASPREDATLVRPYVILEREVVDGAGNRLPLKIGVIGFTPPQIMIWDRAHLEGNVEARDIVEAAAAWVPEMREAGADLIVALSHSGIAAGSPEGAENASLFLGSVPGIDVILTGHQHRVFPGSTYEDIEGADLASGTLLGKPAVMPGFWGSHLGIVDLMLAHEGNEWRVVEAKVENRPIYERVDNKVVPLTGVDEAVLDAARAEHEETLAYVRRPVGETSAPINSYFALVADDPSVQIVSNAQIWYVSEILKGGEYADLPVLSAAAPFKAGGRGGPDYYTDVQPGPVAIKNVADLYLYPNTVRAVLIDGATVKEWLECSAGIFNRIDPEGGEQALIDDAFPSYNFDVIDGVTYEIDVTQPSKYGPKGELVNPDAERIRNLRHQGRPIEPLQKFVVATNNYRAAGGGDFPGLDGSNIILEAPDTNRDVLVRYIVEQKTINPSADDNWRIAPVGGNATLIFETGPGAEPHAEARDDIAHLGPGEDGFARYELKQRG
ncbi:MAG TPA: bifunctional 2',3'-cyclic-nucleotide 2'-phosphodiesterase/3'-nucleotidase [Geminicoccaceae bacterium]|nr:bifunctional 2',3'-cyclic-nucleotide 2'-phosphodiesterase/3'-nucleotidase [Geminicoccaceae bacterium]